MHVWMHTKLSITARVLAASKLPRYRNPSTIFKKLEWMARKMFKVLVRLKYNIKIDQGVSVCMCLYVSACLCVRVRVCACVRTCVCVVVSFYSVCMLVYVFSSFCVWQPYCIVLTTIIDHKIVCAHVSVLLVFKDWFEIRNLRFKSFIVVYILSGVSKITGFGQEIFGSIEVLIPIAPNHRQVPRCRDKFENFSRPFSHTWCLVLPNPVPFVCEVVCAHQQTHTQCLKMLSWCWRLQSRAKTPAERCSKGALLCGPPGSRPARRIPSRYAPFVHSCEEIIVLTNPRLTSTLNLFSKFSFFWTFSHT